MERNGWQALQRHLKDARTASDEGDAERALIEVEAALAIDPEFTAALALRDRIKSSQAPQPLETAATPPPEAGTAAPRPLISAEGYARFEARARQRRIERRTQAARAAIAAGCFEAAAAAIDEIRHLDPDAVDLSSLVDEMASARSGQPSVDRRPSRFGGPQIVAAAVFACVMLAAPRLQQHRLLFARPIALASTLAADVQPSSVLPDVATVDKSPPDPTATAGTTGIESPRSAPEPARVLPLPVAAREPGVLISGPPVPLMPRPSPPADSAPRVLPPPPSPAPAAAESVVSAPSREPPPLQEPTASPPSSTHVPIGDDALIREALQRYRAAYERLDAQSAQAAYPAVNERALARAFDDLESQHLTFDNCDVRVIGESASAACRGTARYVPKVGSRDPRTEARVWSFTLRKDGADWTIDSARVER